MALTLVGSAAGSGTTIAIPAHKAGDLIVIMAYRSSSTTAPTLPSGWTNILNGAANTNAARLARRFASDGNTVSGTWTNATHLVVQVWRGGMVGAAAQAGSSSATIGYPSLSVQTTDGTSRIACFAGHRTASDVNAGTSRLTNRATNGSGPQVAVHDSGSGVSSWAADSQPVNSNSGWRSFSLEIAEIPAAATVTSSIASNADDGAFSEASNSWVASDPSEFVFGGRYSGSLRWAGFRFQNISVPVRAKIVAARFKPKYYVENHRAVGVWNGVASGSAPAWSSTFHPKIAPRTTAGVLCSMVGATGSFDVTPIVQELIDRSDWVLGSAIAFALEPYSYLGEESFWWQERLSASQAGTLEIQYEVEEAPPEVPGDGKKVIVGIATAADRYKGTNRAARYVGTATDWT